METNKMKHFCTCDDLTCGLNPNNPKGKVENCDPCIQKNLRTGEIPSCFFNKAGGDLSDWEDFSMGGFVDFYLKNQK